MSSERETESRKDSEHPSEAEFDRMLSEADEEFLQSCNIESTSQDDEAAGGEEGS